MGPGGDQFVTGLNVAGDAGLATVNRLNINAVKYCLSLFDYKNACSCS